MGRTFDGSRPPARRASDRYLAIALLGAALVVWTIVVRVALTGDVMVAFVYGAGAAAITYGAAGLSFAVLSAWSVRRRRREAP